MDTVAQLVLDAFAEINPETRYEEKSWKGPDGIIVGTNQAFRGLLDTNKILRDAKKTCFDELKNQTIKLGANAVIGIDLDYSEFSGAGKSMLFIAASGTAVTVEPEYEN